MTSKEIHKEHIKEHIQELEDAIAIGIEKRPATIGLHTSACSIELLELYLHLLNKISIGTMIKHEWFKRPKVGQKIMPLAERKLPFIFPEREQLFNVMYQIEEERNKLIYGRPSKASLESVLTAFQKLHDIVKKKFEEVGEEIA